MSIDEKNLVWLDLEMTGLIPERDVVIEMAIIVTDQELNVLEESPAVAIHQPDAVLNAMDEWNTKQHGGSGLVDRVKNSNVSMREAELMALDFVSKWVPPGKSPMCGNSIGQDRRFLAHYMSEFEAYFHYRNLDVSTIKELASRWSPEILSGVKKQGTHLALDDIRDSINELIYYRKCFFK